ncbi:GAF domain-containing protein (plasmid) [Paroceanicella profunda]|uniref:histidine kinase n=1 Tax=Paroceanicella profunda TaxID=2579971 RepID=A0A5B8G5D1_9RHOB|nr:histidine kinase dimerization/phosphoacceptor domain -containing protein [Paroceanicella profunda]QDL94512.1 GAF domain-containing protein [Paroceanicella profunda]
MEADQHPRQAQRLRALRAYEILDTDREADFDDIVRLASAICGTAISVVTLVDADRQWFKAETGLGLRETPLSTSICAHVILEDSFVEIPDTLADPRMADNPLCGGDPGLRFYAGALLETADGLPLGTLCVLDHTPRSLTPLQREALRVLARQVMTQLEMRKALRAASLLRKEVEHRVKNSLQSISSLARLQARSARSQETMGALDAIRARLDAVATLHEHLYRTDADTSIDLGAYVATLCAHLGEIAPPGVRLEAQVAPVEVTAQTAVAVGTLVNELVSNAYKHAFPAEAAGRVRLTLARLADGMVRVDCTDDGVGLLVRSTPGTGGLGLKIAEVACAELRCALVTENTGSGLSASFEFLPATPAPGT